MSLYKKKKEFLIVISFCDLKDHGHCVKFSLNKKSEKLMK